MPKLPDTQKLSETSIGYFTDISLASSLGQLRSFFLTDIPFRNEDVVVNINELPGGSSERVHGTSSRKINPVHIKNETQQSAAASSSSSTGRARDPEVIDLVRQLASAPEIRPDVVEAAKAKIASGEFFSRANAEATARAFLR